MQNPALFLDFDGTLVEIADRPEEVIVPGDLVSLLERLCRSLDGAVAIVTGRTIGEIDRFLDPLRMVTAGIHGAELRLRAGAATQHDVPPLSSEVMETIERIAGAYEGTLVERKRSSIAVHFRAGPAVALPLEAQLRRYLDDISDHLMISPGRQVMEVVPRSISKGATLERLMLLPPFAGRRPIMIGDDFPDESAISTARRLGGVGLCVRGEHFGPQSAHFDGPADVRLWLAALEECNRHADTTNT